MTQVFRAEVTNSDDLTIRITANTANDQLLQSREAILKSTKYVLLNELRKKVLSNGHAEHYDVDVTVNYAGMIVTYSYALPAETTIEMREGLSCINSNLRSRIERDLAFRSNCK